MVSSLDTGKVKEMFSWDIYEQYCSPSTTFAGLLCEDLENLPLSICPGESLLEK